MKKQIPAFIEILSAIVTAIVVTSTSLLGVVGDGLHSFGSNVIQQADNLLSPSATPSGYIDNPQIYSQETTENALNMFSQESSEHVLFPSPAPTPTPTPTFSPKPTFKPVPKTVGQVIETDPPVHCSISAACGGGTKPLKKSECENSICCIFPDGAKVVSKQECNGGSYNTSLTNTPTPAGSYAKNYVAPTNYPTYTYSSTTPQQQSTGLTEQEKIEAASRCYGDANYAYQQAYSDLNARSLTMGDSGYESALKSLKSQLEQAIAACKVKYGQP